MQSSTPPDKLRTTKLASPKGYNTAKLARAVFDADLPEQLLKELPAQSLYAVIKHNSLDSSHDLLMLAPIDKCRMLLDFDCWVGDRFRSEAYWDWLKVTDYSGDLSFLQKFLKFSDLKLIAILIAQYVDVIENEEPSEVPPDEGYYTPDKGRTWITTKVEDQDLDFQLRRLLAMIFETDARLFYDLLAISQNTTISELEERSYEDRGRRLATEGIPDRDFAAELCAPKSLVEIKLRLSGKDRRPVIEDIPIVEPLIYDEGVIQPLGSLLAELSPKEEFESEMTLLMNGAIVHFYVDHCDYDEILLLGGKVKGAINIALQIVQKDTGLSLIEIYQTLGLSPLFQLGLSRILELRRQTRAIQGAAEITDPIALAILDELGRPFPALPQFYNNDGSLDEVGGELKGGKRPLEFLEQIESVEATLSKFSTSK